MEDHIKKNGAKEILGSPVFLLFYTEAYDSYMKILELGDPNNPDKLVEANIALRTLRGLKRKFEKAANQGES